MKFKLMKHQEQSLKFIKNKKAILDFSDCGTGKTLVQIQDFVLRHKKDKKALLVLCPKSIMYAAWSNDLKKFAPHLKVSLAYAKNRADALSITADVYVVNMDGVKDLLKYKPAFWKKFGTIVIDECTALKHHTSQRSKAAAKIIKNFEYRRLLTGTPTSNGVCDLWHIAKLCDDGKRLGTSFFGFRSACCTPEQVGPSTAHLKWADKPGIELQIGALISDIVIRHKFEDCISIPENHKYAVPIALSKRHMDMYDEFKQSSIAIMRETTVTAVNAAVLAQKLLQTASGAVYNDAGQYSLVATDRYELVLDLVEAREHCIVFYTWEHQLHELVKEATSRKIAHATWNPDHPELATQFQAGEFQVLFAHPASAGHGLTLTKGTATIWASPTYNLEHFLQGLKRIHRIGQSKKTETIVIIAENTIDEKVYAALEAKNINMASLLRELT